MAPLGMQVGEEKASKRTRPASLLLPAQFLETQLPDIRFEFGGGIFVTLSELGFRGGHFGPAIIFTVLTFSYFLMYRMYRHNLVLAFAFVYATFAVLLITDALAGNFPPFSLDDFISYRILVIGISYER